MKITPILRNITEASSDLKTFAKKLTNQEMISFVFCKNLKSFSNEVLGRKISKIIDVGANNGQFAFMARYCWPNAIIDCFEPDPRALEKLYDQYKNDPNVKIQQLALGEHTSTLELNLGGDSAQNSFLIEFNKESYKSISVNVETLDNLYRNLESSNILLKIDVQGYEMQVLRGAQNILNKINFILVEVSLSNVFANGTEIDDLWTFLKKSGFIYNRIIDQYRDPISGNTVQMDILFEKQ